MDKLSRQSALRIMIGTLYTEGPKLMAQVEEHTKSYDVDIIKSQLATGIEKKELIEVNTG